MITRYDFDSATAQTYTAIERERIGALIEEHGQDYDSLANLIADYFEEIYADSITTLSERRAQARVAYATASVSLRAAVVEAYRTGSQKSDLARRAGITRATLDKWLGEV